MLDSFLNLFQKKEDKNTINDIEDLNLLCGLMIEAANTDGKVTQNEVDKISYILIDIFKQEPKDVEKVLTEALNKMDTSRSLFFFTSKINKSFSDEKKLLLIETLWEIILADGEVHDFESNLIRRLAGLLYISDVSCGNAKNKALQKINQEGLKS